MLALAQYGVRWAKWLPGGAAHGRRLAGRRLRGAPAPAPVVTIPVGTCNQLDLPLVPIGERAKDLFFAGSLEHQESLRDRPARPRRARAGSASTPPRRSAGAGPSCGSTCA